MSDDQVRIYEGSSITVKGEVIAKHADLVEEVTFKFFADGEQSEEKTVPMKEGARDAQTGNVTVTHTLKAAVVPDDKDSYLLDYHVFYKVKHPDGSTDTEESLAVKKFEVLPRTAQLAVTHVKDGKPVPNFQFKVFQGGEQVGGLQSTFAKDTPNAKGETVPAGTAEFNLGLVPGFRIVQASPYEIAEETSASGRKRSVKGQIKFRAVFVAPKRGDLKQWVNLEPGDEGRNGQGYELVIGVAPEGDEDRAVKVASADTKIHFRVTFGPESGEVQKSKRDDADRPTKAAPTSAQDKTVKVEEKSAKTKYQGEVSLGGGVGFFKVGLGVAGGDTCLVEIAGSSTFLDDAAVPPDQALRIENWRRLYYELMVPDLMAARVLDEQSELGGSLRKRLESLGKQLYVEMAPARVTVFDAMQHAGEGTLLRASFLGLPGPEDSAAYVLGGRNWRQLPDGQSWGDQHPGKTLCIAPCDALLKWRKDTAEPQAAPKDYSATLNTKAGSLDMEKTFGGLFLPFSADDGGDGITGITWTADISKSDACCKYTPALEVEEVRDVAPPGSGALTVYLAPAEVGQAAMLSFELKDDKYQATLSAAHTADIQGFVDQLLADREALVKVQAKLKVQVAGPEDAGKGEGACFDAVKNKLKELFDSSKKDVIYHPGLTEQGEPRSEQVSLADISDVDKCTTRVWHYRLGEAQIDGTPGPGAFVGAAKSAGECPVKLELSVQPHKAEPGAAAGHLLAFVADPKEGAKNLVRFVLQAMGGVKDKAALKHGHGSDGKPGDCLASADALCADCVAFGRSLNLEQLP